jgi:L-phenylalanine/L-methionine N-acetyltransferase
MSDIVIRALEPSDVEALHEIFSCPRVSANTLQVPWRPLESTRARFGHYERDRHVLVALIDGRVIGNIGLEIVQTLRRRDVGQIGMSVHDDFQGRGVGTAMMAAILDLADNWLGLRRIELDVWTDNVPAIRLYQKFGFVIEGTAYQYARRAGEFVDAHFMARLRS